MIFRIGDREDLEALNEIAVKSKGHWGYPQSWMDHWMHELTIDEDEFSSQNIIVLEIDHQLAGFCSVIENEEHYEILHLWILPEYIRKGYGKKLLERTIELFVRTKKPIIVESDPNAEAFYHKQGFTKYDMIESFPKGRMIPVMKKNNIDWHQ